MGDPPPRRPALGIALLLLAQCAPPESPGLPAPEPRAPEIRIGVVVGVATLSLGGGGALLLSAPDGGVLTPLPAGSRAAVTSVPAGLRVRLGGAELTPGPALIVRPADSSGSVRLNEREYRGRFILSAGSGGISAINLLDLEDYLVGVVGAELGPRSEAELAGLRAQAVVSRTIALKAVGRWRLRGHDLLATTADQLYGGTAAESPLAAQAVRETRGEVLTWQGQLIDGFFHSTCGGRTAVGTEVFAAADRPYLRSIRDEDESGRAWCADSPRFRWEERWTGETLVRTLATTLPSVGGTAGLATTLRDVRILERSASGRVARLEVSASNATFSVNQPAARLLLRGADGAPLRSASFTLQLTRSGSRIVQLVAQGSGAGHGVGLCQWGALGRARAGFSYQAILSAYFPGTELTRTY